MRIETRTEAIPTYDVEYDEMGEIISQTQTGVQEVTITELYADAGMVFVEKAAGKIMSDHITLGTDDSVENYSEMPITKK